MKLKSKERKKGHKMLDLNSDEIKKLDPQDTIASTKLLADQCLAAWEEANALELKQISGIKNIVFCGMGASIYGALVAKALLANTLKYPVELITDYHLPSYVDENTLVVLTSYSGSTEEVLSCADEALETKCKMLVLTKGGKLQEFAEKNAIDSYIFSGKLNPAGVPRLGIGYSVIGLLALLNKTGVISLDTHQLLNAMQNLKTNLENIKDQAMNDYTSYINKIPVIFSGEHLSGNAQILRNQFNETSKMFSTFYLIPDLNHHLMEGLQFPTDAPLLFLFQDSDNYSSKIKRRFELTHEVVVNNNREILSYNPKGEDLYQDFLIAMAYGSFITLFLGLHYKQNPATNPWVDYFKEELAK